MQIDPSPLARPFPDLPPIAGVTLRVARARYKTWDRCDLTLAEVPEGTSVAGVFTKSACASSEVELGREAVKLGRARALIVNAGNSNAFTGWRGRAAVEAIRAQIAEALACTLDEVFVSSTGVIGVPLPVTRRKPGSQPRLRPSRAGGRMRRTPSAPPTPSPRAQARARCWAACAWSWPGSSRAPA